MYALNLGHVNLQSIIKKNLHVFVRLTQTICGEVDLIKDKFSWRRFPYFISTPKLRAVVPFGHFSRVHGNVSRSVDSTSNSGAVPVARVGGRWGPVRLLRL
jgi:hypothetical protein